MFHLGSCVTSASILSHVKIALHKKWQLRSRSLHGKSQAITEMFYSKLWLEPECVMRPRILPNAFHLTVHPKLGIFPETNTYAATQYSARPQGQVWYVVKLDERTPTYGCYPLAHEKPGTPSWVSTATIKTTQVCVQSENCSRGTSRVIVTTTLRYMKLK